MSGLQRGTPHAQTGRPIAPLHRVTSLFVIKRSRACHIHSPSSQVDMMTVVCYGHLVTRLGVPHDGQPAAGIQRLGPGPWANTVTNQSFFNAEMLVLLAVCTLLHLVNKASFFDELVRAHNFLSSTLWRPLARSCAALVKWYNNRCAISAGDAFGKFCRMQVTGLRVIALWLGADVHTGSTPTRRLESVRVPVDEPPRAASSTSQIQASDGEITCNVHAADHTQTIH